MLRRASLALLFLLCAQNVIAQDNPDPLGWNSARALDLMERARVRRELPRGDSSLHNYQAKANGYVYFYLDRQEDNERTLVKVDQIALDLYWKRPNLTKQRIVGLRDVSRLPNRMTYHLDHLTVVQNGLGDVIRIGDGDEVRDVPHPAAPGADSIYDFRVADSVTLQLGGGQPEVRVYEIQTRPKRMNRSAFIGSVYVDRGSADIVRMTFTFTPVSYVDKRLDYINISLDNGLFGGQYWLPHEQSVEIRRQIPELDFAAGAVIKGRITVGDYKFNEPISDSVFFGRPVSAAPQAQRESYPFPQDVYAGLNEEGLAPPPQMADLRKRAAELMGQKRLSGLPTWRLYAPNTSAVFRHNNAEGWYGGLGVTYAPSPSLRVDMLGGYAFGAEHPAASVAVRMPAARLTLRGYYNEPRDIGPVQGMPGAFNTITSGFGDDDYTDTYLTRGASVRFQGAAEQGWHPYAVAVYEQQRAADGVEYRTRSSVDDGEAMELTIGAAHAKPIRGTSYWSGDISTSYVRFAPNDARDEDKNFLRLNAKAEIGGSSADLRQTLLARIHVGIATINREPWQYNYLVGGRETLPGYKYREFDTPRFALANVELARTIAYPWIRARLLGNMALTNGAFILDVDAFERADTEVRVSGGIGAGLLWDAIRVDLIKGRDWQTLISVKHNFWDLL